jgi:hypothetical protein
MLSYGIRLVLRLLGAVPFGVYAIVQVTLSSQHRCTPSNRLQNFSIALQLQPQCFGGLTLITWGQTLYYHKYVVNVDILVNLTDTDNVL